MTTNLILVRHAEPGWEAIGNDVNRDPPLTALGREQATRVGRWLKANYTINTYHASAMARARETAQIANEHLQLPVTFADEFREWSQPGGVISVLPKNDGPFDLEDPFGRHVHEKLPPAYWTFAERILQRLRIVVQGHWDETILIVCHVGGDLHDRALPDRRPPHTFSL